LICRITTKLTIIVYLLVILVALYGDVHIDLPFLIIQAHQVIQPVLLLNRVILWVSLYQISFNSLILASSRSSFLDMIGFKVRRRKPTEIPPTGKRKRRISEDGNFCANLIYDLKIGALSNKSVITLLVISIHSLFLRL
jgi:hypothetical protein